MAEFDYGALSAYLQPSEEDKKRALQSSLMAAGFGILANNNQRGMLGPALGAGGLYGMQNYAQTLHQLPKERGQALTQAMQMQKIQRDAAAQTAFSRMYGGANPGSAPASMTAGAPGAPSGMPVSNSLQGGAGPTLEDIGRLMAIDPARGKAALDLWQAQNPTAIISGGHAFNPRQLGHGQQLPQTLFTPSGLGVGTTPNPGGLPTMAPLPGSTETAKTFADINERARAGFDIVPVPFGPVNKDGTRGTIQMTREQAAEMARRNDSMQPEPQTPPPSQPGKIPIVAKDLAHMQELKRQYDAQGIPVTIRYVERGTGRKVSSDDPVDPMRPNSAPRPIATPGGPVPTDALLNPPAGYTPPKKAEPTGGQKAVDTKFADEYVQFKASGGYADVVKQLATLRDASKALETDDTLTGPLRGMLPDSVRAVTNPAAVSTKDKVAEVVQRNLRLVLGAQFTEKEGERLVQRAYNPQLSTAENKVRVDRLITQIEKAAQAKQDAADYFEQNGTLTGWAGKLYSIDDISAGLEGESKPISKPPLQNVSDADIRNTALKHGLTVDQVKERLRKAGAM